MKVRFWLVVLVAIVASAAITPLVAQQQADIIRGRIIGPDSLPLPNVNVLVSSAIGGINKTAKTDKNGKFSVVFPNGEGDYWVGLAAIGFNFKRFELKRISDEEVLIADSKLDRTAQRLDTVNVTANAKRTTPPRASSTFDASGTDKSVGNAGVGAGQAGNIAAMLGTLPGFQLIPGVDGNPDLLSVFGLDPTQNNTSLNGGTGSSGDLPRDASVGVGASTSPWDVSRGGFSGAQVQLTTRSGSNYQARSLSSQFDAPALQWTDNIGNATPAQYTRLSPGASAGGSITQDRSFYNLSAQFDRTLRDVRTLFNTNALGLQTAGVAPDSADRLKAVLLKLGIPSGIAVGDQALDQFRQQGAFDFSPKAAASGSAYQIAENFNVTHSAPTSTSLMATPAFSGENTNLVGIAVARHTNYLWSSVLTQTWLTTSLNNTHNDPTLAFPGAGVRVSSELDDGTSTVRTLQFGGNSSLGRDQSVGSVSARNQLNWYAGNNRHALKLTTEFRDDWYSLDDPTNRRGTFTFQSLADLEAGRPSQFTRQLATLREDAKQFTASVALGDAWRPSTNVQVVYGVRVDGNHFLSRPDYNPAVMDAVGVRNDNTPNKVYFSPRAGVSWNYGTAAVIPINDGYTIGPRAIVRAGVGLYQNMRGADMLGSTLNQTGLPGASQTLTCVGQAAPLPDWAQYQSNPAAIPNACADGSSAFASNLPSVAMFDKNFAQARTVKSNVNWYGGILDNRYTLTVDATYSIGLNQPGSVDLNFNPVAQFALDNEGGRPVFARATSIDPFSGLVATRDARRSSSFTQIRELTSNLRNDARQISFSLSPYFFNPTRFRWSAGYTFADYHDRFNGFSSTAGSPLGYESARSSNSLHQFQYSLTYNFWDYVTVTWSGGFRSGVRYTPAVAGDINGDGTFGNDRAFVFNPATAGDPALVASMQALLANAPSGARKCLQQQIGAVAGRNTCTGPWTASANSLTLSLNSMKVWMPPRTRFTISIANPLVAADLLFHGSSGLHGWGETPSPDASLLYVRGFDPATQQYKYEVNPRFGSTSLSQSIARSPVIVTAGFSVDVAPTRDWQSVRIALDRGRTKPGTKLTEAQLRSMQTALGVINPMATILQRRDVLKLNRKQADSLSNLSRTFAVKLDSLWTPIATYYNSLPNDFNHGLAHEKFVEAREVAADYLIKVAPGVKSLLTAAQLRKLSGNVALYLEPRYLTQLRAGLVSSGLGLEMMMMQMR